MLQIKMGSGKTDDGRSPVFRTGVLGSILCTKAGGERPPKPS